MASDGLQELRASPLLGGSATAKNPTDRGKLGAKMNLLLLIDERGAPLSVVLLTGANRHTTQGIRH